MPRRSRKSTIRRFAALALAIASVTFTGGVLTEPVRIIDLATFGTPAGVLQRIYGSSGDGAKGVPVAAGGDVDVDGFVDTALSAVQASPLGRAGAGEMIVVFGDGTLGGTVTTADFAPGLLKIAGQHANEVAGVEIEIADVTGDGVADLLLGRQNHTPEVGRPGAGGLTILAGGPELRDHAETLAYLDLGAIPAALTATTFIGASSYDRLGIWLRTGDVDGDGILDIVVGADEVDADTGDVTLNNGAVYVLRGGPHLDADQIVDLADFGTMDFPSGLAGHVARVDPPSDLPHPPSNKYHFGATCQIGDLDGDGKGEVIAAAALNRSNAGIKLAGAPGGTGEATGGSTNGSVFIVWGDLFPATAWTSGYTIDFDTASPVTRIDGSVSSPDNDELGEDLLALVDYDGDGTNDLFLGDLAGNSLKGLGHVIFNVAPLMDMTVSINQLIVSPPAGVRHTLILGPTAVSISGDTAMSGDYDGDGLGDLAYCNPKDDPHGRDTAGTIHVLYGEVDGWPATIDLAAANLPAPAAVRIVQIEGAEGTSGGNAGDTLCYSAADGDVDDDGLPDLLFNEMEGDGFGPDGGDVGSDLDPAPDVGNLVLLNGASLLERVLLDVDGNGDADPLTDGLLVLRYLFGFTGTSLTAGALGAGATRTGPEIEDYLERAGAALDADADDTLQPLTDGVLILRYLFGFSGEVMVAGALDPQGARTDPGEITSFLERLEP